MGVRADAALGGAEVDADDRAQPFVFALHAGCEHAAALGAASAVVAPVAARGPLRKKNTQARTMASRDADGEGEEHKCSEVEGHDVALLQAAPDVAADDGDFGPQAKDAPAAASRHIAKRRLIADGGGGTRHRRK